MRLGTVEPAVLNIDKPDWMLRAACIGFPMEWWFPGPGQQNKEAATAAKQICRNCPVVNDCLEYALSWGPRHCSGIWGMTTERERNRIHKSTTGACYSALTTRP